MGRLRYRYSYGENVLQHSIEVAHLAALMAAEIGANVQVSKEGGLLHDIGKALTHEVEGPHAEIGADVATKNKVRRHVCDTIREHHDDVHSSAESFIVAGRGRDKRARGPGPAETRSNTISSGSRRWKRLPSLSTESKKCYAIQAGREVRILVEPERVDDLAANKMAREVVKQIEATLAYPGQIKVTVIRESRSVEFAR